MQDEMDPAAAPEATVEAAPQALSHKTRGHHTGSDCEVCGNSSVLRFESGSIVETCDPLTGCGAAIRWPAEVLRKPAVDSIRHLPGTRFELGLIGKRNYQKITGTVLPSGRQVKVADPTDPEGDDLVQATKKGLTANALAKKSATAKKK